MEIPSEVTSHYGAHLDELKAAYDDHLSKVPYGCVVLHSGSLQLQSRFDDLHWPFRATPEFLHWLPLREPNCFLLIEPGTQPILFRTEEASYWDAPTQVESEHFWHAFDVRDQATRRDVGDAISNRRVAFVGDDVNCARELGISETAINPDVLVQRLHRARLHKTDYELACVAFANQRAAVGHVALRDAFTTGHLSELELHLLYLRHTMQCESDAPYSNIVALGPHAATLHYIAYQTRAVSESDTSLLVDAGAQCLGYASDITRTWVKGHAEASQRFGRLVDGVRSVQDGVIAACRLGTRFEALHDLSHQLLATVLVNVGLARGNRDNLVEAGVTRCFFPHGLGHALGLQVHDVGGKPVSPRDDNRHLRATFELTPGLVFTIEPGCYFIPPLLGPLRDRPEGELVCWDIVEQLSPYGGVRMEDNVVVTGAGTRNLTRDNWPDAP